jgi:hypothetical protein
MICKLCAVELPYSKKPNKSKLCNSCYKKTFYQKWISKNDRSEYRKQYAQDNRTRLSQNKKIKYNADLNFKLKETLRTRLAKAIQRDTKTGSAVKDLGCSIAELKSYLETKWQTGMNWENYGKWHIDHIKPLSMFDLTDAEQFKQACHYTNLQPLWAEDNIRKSDNYD